MEGVAARAGSGKAPIYRRWTNRVDLVRAAMYREASAPAGFTGTTGTLRGDLIAELERFATWAAGPVGEAMRGIIGAAGESPPPAGGSEQAIPSVLQALDHARQRSSPDQDSGITFRQDPSAVAAPAINIGMQLASLDFLSNGVAPARERIEEIVDVVWLPLLRSHLDRG